MSKLLFLTRPEVSQLLQAAKESSAEEHALLSTIYFLGLRASEATCLKVTDFDYDRKRVLVTVLKRRWRPQGNPKKTTHPSHSDSKKAGPPRIWCDVPESLAELLKEQAATATRRRSNWLFSSKRKPTHKATRFYVTTVYFKLARRIGLEPGRVRHVHCLRHSRAMHHIWAMRDEAEKKGKTIPALEMMKELQMLLRHATEQMCLHYIHTSEETAKFSEGATSTLADEFL